jgi:CheY-like chemotaxis protein
MSHTKILVVDDFLPWQQFVLEMFESHGAGSNIIYFALDGLEAVEKAQQLQPDLILMDVSLPVMNGFEAARKIRGLSPRSKILFVSELRGRDYIQGAFEAGASGYILKSDANSDLFQGIVAALHDQQFVSHGLNDWPKGFDPSE